MTRPGGPQQTMLPVYEAFLPREHALYRPRHGGKQLVALICATVFFLTPNLSVVFGARPGEFENRALTPFPSLGQGWSFFPQLGNWATDHLVLREQAVHTADGISRGVFGEPPPLNQEHQQGPLQVPGDTKLDPRQFPTVIEGKNGWLYLGDEVTSHCVPTENLDTTFDRLRQFRDGIEASGRQLVVVIAPDKATMVPEHLPDNYLGKDCHDSVQNDFWRRVDAENFMVDLRKPLQDWANRKGQPLYGPLDAHWNDEGAITAVREVTEKLRPGITSSWRVQPKENWELPADLPRLIGRTGLTDGTHYALMPDGRTDLTRTMPGDYIPPVHTDTASGTGTYGLRTAWLGDSFTIRTLPYMAATFRDLTAMHYSTSDSDSGAAIADLLERSDVVVVEFAERGLIAGAASMLTPSVQQNIFRELNR
ncbi:alginate O-acetyltransferase AlgX-related protein [Amycolatopsis sp. NPDC004772]